MSFINTEKTLKIGKHYQYQDESLTGFGDKEIIEVTLLKDNSDKEYWRLVFKPLSDVPEEFELDKKGNFEVVMMKGDFYYPGMPRIWDEGEYSY